MMRIGESKTSNTDALPTQVMI